ncbi:YybH family protein [Planotetraspora mira]|uniref:SnoaL-like domain-containing protein n=1 Tax=Planotetraspora mira TaxID=58121 RepID=A0A8J3TNJ8_9ACTN|nr:nuclear transport factor 2 family protein [Planotetraspora mira]GII30265.1 hypothetical protein Pmi06nite_37070 [Planotetraspora mira]
MDHAEAQRFAEEWAAGWNSHDLDRIMTHYAAEVVFRSPLAARIIDGSDGVVRGVQALRAYWAEGLRRHPDLRFEVVAVYVGLDGIVINYRDQTGQPAAEVLIFRDGLIVSGMATRGPDGS